MSEPAGSPPPPSVAGGSKQPGTTRVGVVKRPDPDSKLRGVIKQYQKGDTQSKQATSSAVGVVGSTAAGAIGKGVKNFAKGDSLSAGVGSAALKGAAGYAAGQMTAGGYRRSKAVMNRLKPARAVMKSKAFQNYVDPALSIALPVAGGAAASTLLGPEGQGAITGLYGANVARKAVMGQYNKYRAKKKYQKMSKRS